MNLKDLPFHISIEPWCLRFCQTYIYITRVGWHFQIFEVQITEKCKMYFASQKTPKLSPKLLSQAFPSRCSHFLRSVFPLSRKREGEEAMNVWLVQCMGFVAKSLKNYRRNSFNFYLCLHAICLRLLLKYTEIANLFCLLPYWQKLEIYWVFLDTW